MKTANGGKNKAKILVKLVFEVNVKKPPADQPSQTPGTDWVYWFKLRLDITYRAIVIFE